jgi:hypothetical protein
VTVIIASAIALFPALLFDARLLLDPTGQPLPRIDDEAYVSGFSAGTPWKTVAGRLRGLAGPGPAVVAAAPFCCGSLPLELRHDRALSIAQSETADVHEALFAIENGIVLPPRSDGMTWHRIWTYERPRGHSPVYLYESGVLVDLEFASTPDELRRLVGGTDADFDGFVAAHPAVGGLGFRRGIEQTLRREVLRLAELGAPGRVR